MVLRWFFDENKGEMGVRPGFYEPYGRAIHVCSNARA
jgi:hypothetical protein